MIDHELQEKIEKVLVRYSKLSPVDIAERLKIKIVFVDQEDSFAGAIKKVGEDVTIYINSKHPPKRQSFSIAHELGHFFLHGNDLDNGIISYRHTTKYYTEYTEQDKQREEEANHFAAEILMPKKAFEMLANQIPLSRRVKDLAKLFNVSENAARVRLSYLDILYGN